MKLDLNKFVPVTWKPKQYQGLVDDDNKLIRALVSKDMILIASRDLDRLRGLTSNASNQTWRMYRNQETYGDQLFRVTKRDFAGTNIFGFIKSAEMMLVDSNLAKSMLSNSSKPGAHTAYKTFVNGIYQKAKHQQALMQEVTE